MTLVTAYTEVELAELMADLIGPEMEATLEWAIGNGDAGDYRRAVNATLRMIGVTDIASASDMAALEVAARYAVWDHAAMRLTVMMRTTLTIGADLSSLYENAKSERNAAYRAAMRYGISSYSVSSSRITYAPDAYGSFEDPNL